MLVLYGNCKYPNFLRNSAVVTFLSFPTVDLPWHNCECIRMLLTFSTLGARALCAVAWEGPGNGGGRGLDTSPFGSTADTLGGVRQDKGEERGNRGREAGEERGEGPKLGPGDTMDGGRPKWPEQREGDELWGRSGEMATVGRSGLPAGGLWTKRKVQCVSITKCSRQWSVVEVASTSKYLRRELRWLLSPMCRYVRSIC